MDGVTCARCPFCGSADLQLVESVMETGIFICCLTCEGAGPPAETAQLALEKWCQRFGTADVLGYNFQIVTDYLT